MLPWSYDEDIKKNSLIYFIFHNIKCHQISALTIIFWGNFCRHGIKTRKSWLIFFFQVSVMSILAINSNRWHETVSIPKCSVDHFGIQLNCDEMFQLFKKIVNGMTSSLKVCSIRQFYRIFQLLTVKELFKLLTLNLKGLSQVF